MKYRITARFTKGPDHGICQAHINGIAIGKPFDAYAPTLSAAEQVELGETEIKAGNNLLTLEAVGRNPASQGFKVGLDFIRVIGR